MVTATRDAAERKSRTVNVSIAVWAAVQTLVASGQYRSVSHATEEALKRLIDDHESDS